MTIARFVPVLDKNGDVVLYDIFIENKWHGSRRTIPLAKEYASWLHRQNN